MINRKFYLKIELIVEFRSIIFAFALQFQSFLFNPVKFVKQRCSKVDLSCISVVHQCYKNVGSFVASFSCGMVLPFHIFFSAFANSPASPLSSRQKNSGARWAKNSDWYLSNESKTSGRFVAIIWINFRNTSLLLIGLLLVLVFADTVSNTTNALN